MNQIQLIAAEQAWNGSYSIKDGQVCVASAYGAERAPIASQDEPEAVALELFQRIIKRRYPAVARVPFRTGRPYAARG